jgi:hypothetical protein
LSFNDVIAHRFFPFPPYDFSQGALLNWIAFVWVCHFLSWHHCVGQGNDVGSQYRSGIYFHTPEQKEEAIASMKEHQSHLWKKIATEILPAGPFYMAEEYHQQYLQKGGGGGKQQSAAKMCTDPIRCYG